MAKRRNKQGEPKKNAAPESGGPAFWNVLLAVPTWLLGPLDRQNAWEWAKTIVIAGGLALAIRWAFAEPYRIPSGSMEPTLHGDPGLMRGDRVFVNKWVYGLRYPFMNKRIYRGAEPKRWDIIVFKSPEPGARHGTLVKRLVALPGERVEIRDGKIHINGEPVEQPGLEWSRYYTRPGDVLRVENGRAYVNDTPLNVPDFMVEDFRRNQGPQSREMRFGILPSDTYCVVPDDHYFLIGDNSPMSRDGRVWGFVPNGNLLGRVFCIWWPPRSWQDFTGFSHTWWWRVIVVLTALLTAWRLFTGRSVRVRADSEALGLRRGDHLHVFRAAFGIPLPFTGIRITKGRAPRMGELVLCHGEADGKELSVLGRVAGIPGDKVRIEDGRLLVNDAPPSEPALVRMSWPANADDGPYGRLRGREHTEVPGGHCFVLGGPDDTDSRKLGWIPFASLDGPANIVWWPPSRWRRP
jgi:signal peptidase I